MSKPESEPAAAVSEVRKALIAAHEETFNLLSVMADDMETGMLPHQHNGAAALRMAANFLLLIRQMT